MSIVIEDIFKDHENVLPAVGLIRKVEPNSSLGKDISYMLNHWDALTVFLKVPGAPLDNNLCEQVLKKYILFRKNSLFYKIQNGADFYVALMRTKIKGKKIEYWALVSTKEFDSPEEAFDTYGLRPKIEERHKQLKECWNLYKFNSTSFSLCAARVYFTLMAYTLIQMYLMRNDLQELTNKTIKTLQMEEKLGQDAVVVYIVRITKNILLFLDIVLYYVYNIV